MRTVGLPISHKENERRRALLPVHIGRIQNKGLIYIEEGYGEVLGFADEDYLKEGIRVVTREEVLTKDIICDPRGCRIFEFVGRSDSVWLDTRRTKQRDYRYDHRQKVDSFCVGRYV